MVFEAGPGIAEAVSSDGTVAVRVPDSFFCLELCRLLDAAVASTSANRAGEEPAASAEDVLRYFEGALDLVIDGGPPPGELPSTIVDVRGDVPVLIREGAVRFEELG
jgi:L-threonylcarbamoyladenylate synthase